MLTESKASKNPLPENPLQVSYDHQLAVELMRETRLQAEYSNDLLDKRVTNFSTLATSIAGATGVVTILNGDQEASFQTMLAVIAILLALIVLWIAAKYYEPIERKQLVASLEECENNVFRSNNPNKSAKCAIKLYEYVLENIKEVNDIKADAVKGMLLCLHLELILLGLVVSWPFWGVYFEQMIHDMAPLHFSPPEHIDTLNSNCQ